MAPAVRCAAGAIVVGASRRATHNEDADPVGKAARNLPPLGRLLGGNLVGPKAHAQLLHLCSTGTGEGPDRNSLNNDAICRGRVA